VSSGRVGIPEGLTSANVAQELREIAWAGCVSTWGATAVGTRILRWLLEPMVQPAASPYRTPVVLVHGYGGSRANWITLELVLRRAGFENVHTAGYNSVTATLSGVAEGVRKTCHEAMEAAGSSHVHLVGHSLGGVVVRYAVQRLGLANDVRTAVTVAAPHRGTPLAALGLGQLAWNLRPGSLILQSLDRGAGAGGVRWVAYYSDCDLVVRPESARLDRTALNVAVPGVGHLGILRAPVFLRSVQRVLLAAERPSDGPAPALCLQPSRPRA
jgi:pimeloyl-ACP methyl ester carboxylesterase